MCAFGVAFVFCLCQLTGATIVHRLHVNPPHQSFGDVVRCMRNSTHLHTYRAAAQMASSAELEAEYAPIIHTSDSLVPRVPSTRVKF